MTSPTHRHRRTATERNPGTRRAAGILTGITVGLVLAPIAAIAAGLVVRGFIWAAGL